MSRLFRKLLFSGSILALLLVTVVAGYSVFAPAPAPSVQAQGSQPVDTIALFEPFWEAWDLLHENYVDPLDDDALVEGALLGMLQVVDVPLFEFPIPTIDGQATTTEERFEPFWDTWTRLHENFADSLDDNALMEGALTGMVASIGDPHTDYMDPETFARVNEGMSGEYEGIGAVVRQDEETGGLELISIFEDSPAERAGLRVGDQIVQVEGEDVTQLTQNEIIAMVRGPAGTPIRLGIFRTGEADVLKIEVVRDRINTPSITSELLDDNIGYVQISRFDFSTSPELFSALEALDADNLNGLILDMRGNPGGYKVTSVEVASAFVEEGAILIERGPDFETPSMALGNAVAAHVPMVVLVDQASASASELVAGALQDHHRAQIVGMQTFGKGSVQVWMNLVNGGGLRITISRWYTPDGNSVSEVGITPDVEVSYIPEEVSGDEDNQLTAAIQVLNGTYEATQ